MSWGLQWPLRWSSTKRTNVQEAKQHPSHQLTQRLIRFFSHDTTFASTTFASHIS